MHLELRGFYHKTEGILPAPLDKLRRIPTNINVQAVERLVQVTNERVHDELCASIDIFSLMFFDSEKPELVQLVGYGYCSS